MRLVWKRRDERWKSKPFAAFPFDCAQGKLSHSLSRTAQDDKMFYCSLSGARANRARENLPQSKQSCAQQSKIWRRASYQGMTSVMPGRQRLRSPALAAVLGPQSSAPEGESLEVDIIGTAKAVP